MQVANTIIRNYKAVRAGAARVSLKEEAVLRAIGLSQVPTATEFVKYFSLEYEVSESGTWYTLKKLKERGLLDFMEKGEEGKPLALTQHGLSLIRGGSLGSLRRMVEQEAMPSYN